MSLVGEAAAVIVACALETENIMSCGEKSYSIDIAIAVDHMTLKATEEGLGTCWIGAFRQDMVKEIIGVPNNVRIVILLPIGYPSRQPEPKEPPEYFTWQRNFRLLKIYQRKSVTFTPNPLQPRR